MKTLRNVAGVTAMVALTLTTQAYAEGVLGLTTSNRIVSFDHTTPGSVLDLGAIGGLAPDEVLVGIDLRPATGQVFGISSASRMYALDFSSGVNAIPVGTGFTPALAAGVEYGIDFNPTVDRVRIVNANGFNGRLNPTNGTSVAPGSDTSLTFAAGGVPRAVGTAYTNSLAGVPAGSVRQFIIDSNLDILGEVGSMAGGNASFNGGIVTPIGSGLGFATNDLVGFDISGPSGLSLVSLTDPSTNLTSLYTLSLGTGGASPLGAIGTGLTLRDITIVPAPAAAMMGVVGLVGLSRRRR